MTHHLKLKVKTSIGRTTWRYGNFKLHISSELESVMGRRWVKARVRSFKKFARKRAKRMVAKK